MLNASFAELFIFFLKSISAFLLALAIVLFVKLSIVGWLLLRFSKTLNRLLHKTPKVEKKFEEPYN